MLFVGEFRQFPAQVNKGVGGHHAGSAGRRDDGEPRTGRQLLRIKNLGGIEEFRYFPDPYNAGPPEGCFIYRVVPCHGAGVGMGRPCTLCKSPRLQNNDRFAAGERPCRTHEFSRVAHTLHIDQDAPGSRVISQEIDHVAKIDIEHGAE